MKQIIPPFKTLDEQISLLESRGLTIEDKESAKLYLLDNNYYNVINIYSKFFQQNKDTYLQGTTFEEIKRVHILDTEIKSILLKYLLISEKHFKSILAYYIAELFNTTEYEYLQTNNYSASALEVAKTLSEITKVIHSQNHRKDDNSVKHFIKKYKHVPIWVIINELDFGTVKFIYKFSDHKIRNKVARRLSGILSTNIGENIILDPKNIDTILNNMIKVRNCVAHNNKLMDFKCQDNIPFIEPIYGKYPCQKGAERNSVFSVFLSLQCFIQSADFSILNNTILKRFKKANIRIISINEILHSYGFPQDWHNGNKIEHKKI